MRKALLILVIIIISTFAALGPAYAEEKVYTDLDGCIIQDLSPWIGKTAKELKDTFDVKEEMSHGIICYSLDDHAVDFYAQYDVFLPGDEQVLIQITMNEKAEHKYGFKKIVQGLIVGDMTYYLVSEDSFKQIRDDKDRDDGKEGYIRTYLDPETGLAYDGIFGGTSYLEKIILRYMSLSEKDSSFIEEK